MINLFKKSRRELAGKDQKLKYLRYAIGEVVLVTIGILIALSINNWNSERKKEIRTNEILQLVLEDIHNDLEEIKFLHETYDRRVPYLQKLTMGEAKADEMLDSNRIGILMGFPDWSIDRRGYDMLRLHSNGNPSDTLVNQIIHIYTRYLPYIDRYMSDLGTELNDLHKVMFKHPWYNEIISADELSYETVEAICSSEEIRVVAIPFFLGIHFELLGTTYQYEDQILELIPLIEDRIKK